jgi:uncharacterized membrane protein YfcA
VGIGVAAGFLSGFLGIGGGLVMVPALVWLRRLVQVRAQALSLAAIVPIAIVGAVGYARSGHIAWVTGATLAAGSLAGAHFGATLSGKLPQSTLRRAFAAVAAVVGLVMLISPRGGL